MIPKKEENGEKYVTGHRRRRNFTRRSIAALTWNSRMNSLRKSA